MRPVALLPVVSFLAYSVLASASAAAECQVTSSEPLLSAPPYAVFLEGVLLYVYEETNDLPGIQRQDEFRSDETCGNAPDTLVT